MLQYVSRDATLFIQSSSEDKCFFVLFFFFLFRKLVKLLSCLALWMILSRSSYMMASIMLSEICHLECVNRSPLSKSVSVQCSVSLPKKREKWSVGQLSKMWSEFQEAALVTM